MRLPATEGCGVTKLPATEVFGVTEERVVCLLCGEALQTRVKHTGAHRSECPWNYYLECPSCGYQNNLAKLLRLECTCDGEEPEVYTARAVLAPVGSYPDASRPV